MERRGAQGRGVLVTKRVWEPGRKTGEVLIL